jgi:hypothetical protein
MEITQGYYMESVDCCEFCRVEFSIFSVDSWRSRYVSGEKRLLTRRNSDDDNESNNNNERIKHTYPIV